MCHNPRHLVSLTLNHLDAILGYVTAAPVRVNQQFLHQHPIKKELRVTLAEYVLQLDSGIVPRQT